MSSTGPTLGVGAIVVRDGALLMVRRGRAPAQGLWSLPGGRVERGESLEDAVRREVAEETGLSIEVEALAGVFEVTGENHYVVVDYLASCQAEQAPVANSDAAEARWVPLDELDRLELTPRLLETLSGWGVIPTTDPK